MTESEAKAVERLVRACDAIEQFREETEKRKPVSLTLLQDLRRARFAVKRACGI